MWPVRTAVSGKRMTPGGATEIMEIIGKDETVSRIKAAIEKLDKQEFAAGKTDAPEESRQPIFVAWEL